jgi:tRNA-Thr(GGU) m(6)t(6)A37 methyltransferase TsaA
MLWYGSFRPICDFKGSRKNKFRIQADSGNLNPAEPGGFSAGERKLTCQMPITFTPIGFVENPATEVPRHWTVSDLEGTLVIQPEFMAGLCDIKAGERIVVLFHFHQSASFTSADLRQAKRKDGRIMGVFSICSPRRPNPIGLSVVQVVAVDQGRIHVKGLDMYDGTPILDIKPYVSAESSKANVGPQ